jgi:hypothetical protein
MSSSYTGTNSTHTLAKKILIEAGNKDMPLLDQGIQCASTGNTSDYGIQWWWGCDFSIYLIGKYGPIQSQVIHTLLMPQLIKCTHVVPYGRSNFAYIVLKTMDEQRKIETTIEMA